MDSLTAVEYSSAVSPAKKGDHSGRLATLLLPLFELLDDDIEWDARPLGYPGVGIYRGHDELFEFWRTWLGSWETYYVTTHDWAEVGDHVVFDARLRATSRRLQLDLTGSRHCQVYTFRDSKVIRLVMYPSRDEALRAIDEFD